MRTIALILTLVIIGGAALPVMAAGPYPVRLPATKTGIDPAAVTMVGTLQRHVIQKGEDLLEIA